MFPKSKIAFEKLRSLATLRYKPEFGGEVANPETSEGLFNFLTSSYFQNFCRDEPELVSDDTIFGIFSAYYRFDIEFYKRHDKDILDIQKDLKGTEKKKWFFVTVGFDDKQENVVSNMKTFLKKFKDTPKIDIEDYVVEKFRKNDKGQIYEHHHIHFLIHTDYSKSKVIQFCFQKAKGFIQGQQFIDVKNDGEISRYQKYIKGDKIESKKECCELDRLWRHENSLN